MNDPATDALWMDRALVLAASARPSPNPRVGCVLVRDGQRVGEGFHHFAGGPHAELVALHSAGDNARGATAYVTLEPCNHQGRTPPCTEALLRAGVTRVVAGTLDPNPHVDGGGLEYLASRGLTVEVGVQQKACELLLRSWRHHLVTGHPWVTLKVAMSLDGRIATRNRHSQWLTGEEARRDAHTLRAGSDAVLVGVGTVLSDDPMLTPRNVSLPGPLPARVVLDSALRTPLSSALCRTANEAPVWLFHAAEAPAERITALNAMGVETVCVPRDGDALDVRAVLRVLGERNVVDLLVEGGGAVHGSMLDARVRGGLVAYLAPLLVGGRDAFSAFGGLGAATLDEATRLRELAVVAVGKDLKLTAELEHVHGDHHSDR